jgi:hypothetical protein
MTATDRPEFTDQQIRTAEVELYRESKIRAIPNRRAALKLLRERAKQGNAS